MTRLAFVLAVAIGTATGYGAAVLIRIGVAHAAYHVRRALGGNR